MLFGSSWCSHCREMLGHFDAIAKTAYQGYREPRGDAGDDEKEKKGLLASLRAALDRLTGKKEEEEAVEAEKEAEGEEGDGDEKKKKKRPPAGRGRFVAARVDFMSRAASHVQYTPTLCVYRGLGARKRVVDAFHGGDAQRLADRAWLHLGGGRRRWGWC